MIIITWKYIGFAVILFLAGLQSIPEELFEAAAIDGATLLADAAAHHAAAARPDDPDLGVPVDHRRAAAVRPRLHHLGPVRRRDGRHLDDGDLHGQSTAATPANYGYGNAVAVVLFLISLVVALIYQRFVLRRDTEGALTEGKK